MKQNEAKRNRTVQKRIQQKPNEAKRTRRTKNIAGPIAANVATPIGANIAAPICGHQIQRRLLRNKCKIALQTVLEVIINLRSMSRLTHHVE